MLHVSGQVGESPEGVLAADVAPPILSESYRDRAVKLGKQVRLVQLEGKEHEIFLEPAVLAELGRLIETVPARRTPAPHAAVPPG